MQDHRAARRYDLSLPIIVRVPTDNEAASWIGKTRDISTRGVYFTIDNNLHAGAELDLTIILPAEVTGGAEVFIKATGKVIRVGMPFGNGEQKVDVAAVFHTHDIVRGKATIA